MEQEHGADADSAALESFEAAALMGVEFPTLTRAELSRTTGYLHKKGGSKGGRRAWARRFFMLRYDLKSWDENYELMYFGKPGDAVPKGTVPLAGAEVKVGGTKETHKNAEAVFEFRLEFPRSATDRKPLEMYADTEADLEQWVETMRAAIECADRRDGLQRDFVAQQRAFQAQQQAEVEQDDALAHAAVLSGEDYNLRRAGEDEGEGEDEDDTYESPAAAAQRNAEMRALEEQRAREAIAAAEQQDSPVRILSSLKIPGDVTALPSGAPARAEFEAAFARDVAASLNIGEEFVAVSRLRAGIVVEFEVNAVSKDRQFAIQDMIALLALLKQKLLDHASDMYTGVLTGRADTSHTPTFKCRYRPDVEHRRRLEERARQLVGIPLRPQPVGMYGGSADERVQAVLARYKGRTLPYNTVDLSHLYITIRFEGIERALRVANPRMYRAKHAVLWDHEVMTALGVTGSLQDRWLQVLALVPHDGDALTLVFEESALHGGHRVVNTALLESGHTYEVEMDDLRDSALDILTEAQKQAIVDNFHSYDADGSGTLSREELETEVQLRTVYRKQQVMMQFDEYIRENPQRRERAEELLHSHTQRLDDAERQLLDMFDRADVDGDGELTLQEFSLAEAWWLSSTVNPEQVKLF